MLLNRAHNYVFAFVMLCLLAHSALAVESIPVKLVGGRVVAKADMKGPAGEVPVHIMIDLGSIDPLIVHKGTYEMMGIKDDKHVDLNFGSAKLPTVEIYAKDEYKEVEELTRKHASELEEIPVSGVLGLGALGDQCIQLDLHDKVIRIGRNDELARSDSAISVAYQQTNQGLRFELTSSTGSPVQIQFSTRQFECLAAFAALKNLKIGTSAPSALLLGESDLIKYGLYRPSGMPGISRPAPDLILGIELLSHFRVTIDPQNKKLIFEQISPPEVQAKEQTYLIAQENADADAIEGFLVESSRSSLFNEAASKLIDLRLSDKTSSIASCEKAIEFYAASLPQDGRAQQLLVFIDTLLDATEGRELAILQKFLELASVSVGKDINGAAIHQLNARKGLLAMRKGDLKQARRLLLSAAFGIPGDPKINLWMGEYYRRNNQPVRAWSRFVEAALSDQPPPASLRELEVLYRDTDFRMRFPISEAELLLEGRLPTYSPIRKRSENENASVQLVELFSTGGNKGAVGPQLAWDGLRQFFDGTSPVFISYHLDGSLGNTAAAERLKLYGMMSPLGVVCDGTAIDLDGADESAAQKLFDKYLPKIAGTSPQANVSIDGNASWKNRFIQTKISLNSANATADLSDLRVYVLLSERCVFALCENGLALHYNVARGAISPAEGLPFDFKSQQQLELSCTLDDILPKRKTTQPSTTQALDAKGPPWMRAAEPDLRECQIVVIVQNIKTYQVIAVRQIPLKEEKP